MGKQCNRQVDSWNKAIFLMVVANTVLKENGGFFPQPWQGTAPVP